MFGRTTLAAMAMLGAFGGAASLPTHTPPPSISTGPMLYGSARRSGKTAAQQKRASKKARNVKRHKQHAR